MSKISRNETEEAIGNILDAVQKYMSDKPKEAMKIYHMTMEAVKDQNETLWFKISLRLGRIYLDQHDFETLDKLIAGLKQNCLKKTGVPDGGDQIMTETAITSTDQYDP